MLVPARLTTKGLKPLSLILRHSLRLRTGVSSAEAITWLALWISAEILSLLFFQQQLLLCQAKPVSEALLYGVEALSPSIKGVSHDSRVVCLQSAWEPKPP